RLLVSFFFQAEDGIRDRTVTGVQTCALPIFTLRVASGQSTLKIGDAMQATRRVNFSSTRRASAICAASQFMMFLPPASRRSTRRSEERRVGKECRSRWSPDQIKKEI